MAMKKTICCIIVSALLINSCATYVGITKMQSSLSPDITYEQEVEITSECKLLEIKNVNPNNRKANPILTYKCPGLMNLVYVNPRENDVDNHISTVCWVAGGITVAFLIALTIGIVMGKYDSADDIRQ